MKYRNQSMKHMEERMIKISKLSIVLSSVAILLCLLVIALWIFDVCPRSVVTAESFIGACVALLGVIVTVAVGSQIVNVMEVKSAQRKYEEELKVALEKIQRQQEQMDEEQHRNSHLHNCNIAKLMQDNREYGKACFYYTCALYEYLQMKNHLGNEGYMFKELTNCISMKDGNWKISEKMQTELKNVDKLLHQNTNYHWVQGQYEPLRNEYFKRIGM